MSFILQGLQKWPFRQVRQLAAMISQATRLDSTTNSNCERLQRLEEKMQLLLDTGVSNDIDELIPVAQPAGKRRKRKSAGSENATGSEKRPEKKEPQSKKQHAEGNQNERETLATAAEQNMLNFIDIQSGMEAWELCTGFDTTSPVTPQASQDGPIKIGRTVLPGSLSQSIQSSLQSLRELKPSGAEAVQQHLPTIRELMDRPPPHESDPRRRASPAGFPAMAPPERIGQQMPVNLLMDVAAPELLDMLRTDYGAVFNSEEEGSLRHMLDHL